MKAGLSRPVIKVERELERLFSFDELKRDVLERLTGSGIDQRTSDKIIEIISGEEEGKNKIADEIRQAVAIYQGQATLGKIINVILHEGRRPLNYFRNQIPNLRYWYKSFRKTENLKNFEKSLSIVEGIGMNAEFFVNLFNKLDPLAAGKRSKKEPLALKKEIENVLAVFEQEMKSQKVIAEITGSDDFRFSSWRQDVNVIFTNLVDNSLYWMSEKKILKRKIIIELATDKDSLLHVDYHDTGPGIEPDHIASEVIFEPHFSTKPSGTGLGLAIAGEAAARNDLELKAFESEEGAWFRLQPKTEDEE